MLTPFSPSDLLQLPVQNGICVVVEGVNVVCSVSLSVSVVGDISITDDTVVVAFIFSAGILQWNLSSQNSLNHGFRWFSKGFNVK